MKGFNWTPEQVRENNEKRRRERAGNRIANGATKLESDIVDEDEKPDAPKSFNARVNITFTVYRRKLLDPDNNYSKHITDTLVSSGVLRNDTANEIEEVRYRQVKIPDWELEKTVIKIEAVT